MIDTLYICLVSAPYSLLKYMHARHTYRNAEQRTDTRTPCRHMYRTHTDRYSANIAHQRYTHATHRDTFTQALSTQTINISRIPFYVCFTFRAIVEVLCRCCLSTYIIHDTPAIFQYVPCRAIQATCRKVDFQLSCLCSSHTHTLTHRRMHTNKQTSNTNNTTAIVFVVRVHVHDAFVYFNDETVRLGFFYLYFILYYFIQKHTHTHT